MAKKGGKTATVKPPKITASKKVRSKSDVFSTLAASAGVSKRQVACIFDTMGQMIGVDLNKGAGVFAVPGLLKITVVRKPATKERQGINPFTKEPTTFKAKPARNVIKVRPLKGLKSMV